MSGPLGPVYVPLPRRPSDVSRYLREFDEACERRHREVWRWFVALAVAVVVAGVSGFGLLAVWAWVLWSR